MIKFIIFDWNATILADTAICLVADNHVLRAFGGKTVNLKTYRDTVGTGMDFHNFYVRHGCNRKKIIRQSKKVEEIFHSFYEAHAAKARTRSGIREVLRWIKKRNILAVILSNHTQKGIRAQLKRLRLESYFQDILARRDIYPFINEKSKHERLEIYLKEGKLKKSEILLIGDSPEEMEIGRRIGAVTVALTGGYYAERRLKEKKPNYLIHNPKSLISIIKKINAQK